MTATKKTRRKPRPPQYFYFAITGIVVTVIGFFPTYLGPLGAGEKSFDWAVHAHGFFGSMWLLLFLAQTLLVRGRRIQDHRRWGYVGVAVAVGVFLSMHGIVYNAALKFHAQGSERAPATLGVVIDAWMFAALVAGATWYRRRPDPHKRLLLLSTILLLWVSWLRLRHYFPEFPGAFNLFGFWLGMMPIPVLWFVEYRQTGRIHPFMLYGGLALLAEQGGQMLLGETALWNATNQGLYELLTG